MSKKPKPQAYTPPSPPPPPPPVARPEGDRPAAGPVATSEEANGSGAGTARRLTTFLLETSKKKNLLGG